MKYVKEHYGKVNNTEIEEHLNIGGKPLNEIAILFQRTSPSLKRKGIRINIHALEGGNENAVNA